MKLFTEFFKSEYLISCRNTISINELVSNRSYQNIIETYDINLKADVIHEID